MYLDRHTFMSLYRHTCTYLDIFISMYRFWNHIYLCPWQDKRTRSRLRVNKLNICCQRRIRNISRGFSNLRGAEHPYPPPSVQYTTPRIVVWTVFASTLTKKSFYFSFRTAQFLLQESLPALFTRYISVSYNI